MACIGDADATWNVRTTAAYWAYSPSVLPGPSVHPEPQLVKVASVRRLPVKEMGPAVTGCTQTPSRRTDRAAADCGINVDIVIPDLRPASIGDNRTSANRGAN